MSRCGNKLGLVACALASLVVCGQSALAQVKVDSVLAYRPTQPDVDYETPTAAEIPQCKLEVERTDAGSGWVLYGPNGQLLRRFMDTNGDRGVDEFRYYKHGLEVYRDIDSNGNNEIDQSRWFTTGGTRWGIDQDEDKKIESWKMISAEEATREAILAMVNRDEKRLAAVLLNAEDVKQLGLQGDAAAKLAAKLKEAGPKFRTVLTSSKVIQPQTTWVRFDCSMLMPNLIPAENGKTKTDLLVYENVMAIVDTAGTNGFVQIGEMVRVGQTWKLTQVPQPLEGKSFELAEGGILLQPSIAGAVGSAEGMSNKMKLLIDQLGDLDAKAPQAQATLEEITKYNVARAQMLALLAEEVTTEEEKINWQRTRLEGIAAATQMKTYPNGLDELQKAETALRQSKADPKLLAFAAFQRLLAQYNMDLEKAAPAERAKIQESWLKALEAFVNEFPKSEESADAMLQLAITYEFNGSGPEATAWYSKLVSTYPQSAAAARAQGALRRLDLKGKPLKLAGKSLTGTPLDTSALRGKVVAVIFWATWCTPCTEDLPQIQQLYQTYQKEGFEIVGVNLDGPGAPIQKYIQNYKIAWPHIYEEGALESRPAVEFGVISLPTMFLIDRNGVVVSSSATVDELKKLVPELVKK
ncbi:redoxin domain-containing protein [Planctomicrobium piriforme]|uniref:Glutathione peroxidase, house-cleaning role in reducing lipid peroxides n=1 Tax=Planctomicrobium piriforme TaxID=1576369 RepID=A0A1I3B805_9PLAN|nr:redoxin domain-containing protein [Planctomicrobium piriforme]SFH58433.1 Glutathione peroxidase, house-cleaning role in reducing lipid peroxides [Planctomicrobium piriforme]